MSDRVSIAQAAVEEDMPLHVLISWLCRSGAILVTEPDPDCHLLSGEELHREGCVCLMEPVHPDITRRLDG
jgi:hypothetical protein